MSDITNAILDTVEAFLHKHVAIEGCHIETQVRTGNPHETTQNFIINGRKYFVGAMEVIEGVTTNATGK
jgi:hypothetical protein